MSTRILLVDDHRVLREGLRSLLEKQTEMQVVGEAGDGRAALQQVRETRPDVVIMDVNMEGMDGIDATRQIIREYPETKVLALSMFLRKTFVSEMFRCGASGYLLKEGAFAEIVEALQVILAGEKYVSSPVAGLLVEEYVQGQGQARSAPKPRLTERETQIVRMLANGQTSKDIALATNTSAKTVDACRRRMMQKVGASSVADVVKYAIREGLTTIDG